MVDPDKDFDQISDAEIDPDSPITTGLMTKIRDALEHLEEWLGDGFVAAKDHDHDGFNSKQVVGTNSIEGVGFGSTHTLVNSASNFIMLNSQVSCLDGSTPFEQVMYKAALSLDLTAFTMTGVGQSILENRTAVTHAIGTPQSHNAVSLPDDTFVNIVSVTTTGGGITRHRIKYNRSTEVITLDALITSPTGWVTTIGMSLIEMIKG